METLIRIWTDLSDVYHKTMEKRDPRTDDWLMLSSPLPTLFLCTAYVYLVKVWGPNYMKNREPLDIRSFLIWYNAFQVAISTYIFVQLLRAGWWNDFSFRCQPVDYSDSPKALLMLHCCWVYYISKFTEFFDTFCFVARKKFGHVSLLHVVHHGIMPLSVWPGLKFIPGGHASFFGLLNTFVHIFMYAYYMLSAMGPKYQKYIWWKQHMTTMQMVQFIGIMAHGFQLVFYEDCGFPWQFSYFIAAHAVMFFILFSQFYIQAYIRPKPKLKMNGDAAIQNGYISNGYTNGHIQNGHVLKQTGKGNENTGSPYNTRNKTKLN